MFSTYLVMAKSAVEYLARGRRLPSWDLKMQVLCDGIRHSSKQTYTLETTDQDIPHLNFPTAIQARMRARDISPSSVPEELGTYTRYSLSVGEVSIDSERIRGIGGVTEQPLLQMIAEDELERQLEYEVLATWDHKDKVNNVAEITRQTPIRENEKILLCLHGGAYTMGSSLSHRSTLIRICETTRLRAFVVNYRLAPKHPFPSQLHDALIFHTFLLNQGFRPQDIILVGDSAGGHLSINLTILLRHIETTLPRALILVSPLVGLDLEGDSLQTNKDFDYLYPYPIESPTSPLRLFYKPGHKYSEQYKKEMTEDPILSPRNAELAGFPPTLIQSGGKEILVDHICLFYDKLVSENSDRTQYMVNQIYDDMVHVFHRFFFRPESKQAFDAISVFLDNLEP
ncbi:hypothetical protein FB645_001089 [Coemansia sp. IMI 203386]|nr:hypothetical protein FB645_001089 [Coemansia sp. IMI 203386]